MPTLVQQNFDGLTPPAVPAAPWAQTGSSWVTTTAQSFSSPNSLLLSSSFTNATCDCGVADTNSGNTSVTIYFYFTGTLGNNTQVLAYLRSTNSIPISGATHYEVRMIYQNTTAVQLYKRIAGSSTAIGSAVVGTSQPFGQNTGIWYSCTLTANGTSLTVVIQQQSGADAGFYLTSSGVWQSGAATCITVTDSGITTAGTAGFNGTTGSGDNIYVDNFNFSSLASAAIAASPTQVQPNVTNQTINLTLTGQTNWTAGTPGSPTFTLSSTGTGASIVSQVVNSTTTATLVIDTGTAGTITITDPLNAVTATVTVVNEVAVDNTNVFLSPGNWSVVPTVGNTLGTAKSVCVGAYVRIGFTGTSLVMNVNGSNLSTDTVLCRAYIDQLGAPIQFSVISTTTSVTLGSGLASGNHQAWISIDALGVIDKWNTPVDALWITGFLIDPSATTIAPTLRTKTAFVFGDSASIGILALRNTNPLGGDSAGDSAWASPWPSVMEALDCEYGQIGYGSTGYVVASTANVPNFLNNYTFYFSGTSRMSGSQFAFQPTYLFVDVGGSDWTASEPFATVTANATTWLPELRTAAPNAYIIVNATISRTYLPPTLAGFENAFCGGGAAKTLGTVGDGTIYQGTTDAKTFFLDRGARLAVGINDSGNVQYNSVDSVHPDIMWNAWIAARTVALLAYAPGVITPSGGSGTGGGLILGG